MQLSLQRNWAGRSMGPIHPVCCSEPLCCFKLQNERVCFGSYRLLGLRSHDIPFHVVFVAASEVGEGLTYNLFPQTGFGQGSGTTRGPLHDELVVSTHPWKPTLIPELGKWWLGVLRASAVQRTPEHGVVRPNITCLLHQNEISTSNYCLSRMGPHHKRRILPPTSWHIQERGLVNLYQSAGLEIQRLHR